MILSNLELSIFNNIKDKKPEITFCSWLHDNELTIWNKMIFKSIVLEYWYEEYPEYVESL
jgi:hypothetical protein